MGNNIFRYDSTRIELTIGDIVEIVVLKEFEIGYLDSVLKHNFLFLDKETKRNLFKNRYRGLLIGDNEVWDE